MLEDKTKELGYKVGVAPAAPAQEGASDRYRFQSAARGIRPWP